MPDVSNPAQPFTLELNFHGDQLELALVNQSTQPQLYLYDGDLQPSFLMIEDAKGQKVMPFDTRSVKKYDNTPYKALYKILKPGQRLKVESEKIEKNERGFSLNWGPFQYKLETNGAPYKIKAEWESALDNVFDDTTKSYQPMEVWKGKVESNLIILKSL